MKVPVPSINMSQRIEKLAVLFADICGSTALYEGLGDDLARRLISQCITTMSKQISAHQGTLIKTLGDEIMCTFPSAEAAFHAACALQSTVRNELPDNDNPMYIRVGFHYGDAILESGDVFGDTVNIAARVASITRAGEIMTTMAAVDALPPALREKTRHVMRTEFKGKQEQVDIFLVVWEQDDMMSTRIMTPAFRKPGDNIDELVLRYRDQSFRINKEHRKAMIGRGDICDVIVSGNMASRQHAAIELRFGKFVMADQSANGTYVRFADGNVVHITREEVPLQGNGAISMGQSFSENPAEVVAFSISSTRVQQ
jgi:adenylate cyclase